MPNTSFSGTEERPVEFSALRKSWILLLAWTLRLLPLPVLRCLHALGRQKQPVFVRGSYRRIERRFDLS